MTGWRQKLGARGEEAAAAYLVGLGYEILGCNWACRYGEIDIVARDGETVVFVEVKLRRPPFDAFSAIDARKRLHLSRAAVAFLSRMPGPSPPARFDAMAVNRDTMACTHIRNAFDCVVDL